MPNIFKLNQIVSKNKYNKGTAATRVYDVVDLSKPGPDDWFKVYNLADGAGLDGYPNVMISRSKIRRQVKSIFNCWIRGIQSCLCREVIKSSGC